jgi:hypothetical protein
VHTRADGIPGRAGGCDGELHGDVVVGEVSPPGPLGAVAALWAVLVELGVAEGEASGWAAAWAAGEAVAEMEVATLQIRRQLRRVAETGEQRRGSRRLAAREGKLDPVRVA